MKFIVSTTLLLVVTAFAAAQTWTEYFSDEGKFAITMPGEPKSEVLTVHLGKGDKHSNMFTYTDDDLNQFMVAYSDRTADEPRKSTNRQLYDKARDGILKAIDGKLLRENDVTLHGVTGREMVIEKTNGSVQTERLFMVGDRLYQVSAQIEKKSAGKWDIEKFLNSFRLTR